MNIFFDVDSTWLGYDYSLRPGTHELMQRLLADGHTIYIWSGMGIRWTEVRHHQLDPYVTDCFVKPITDYVEKAAETLPFWPDLVVDDMPEVAEALGGFWVHPYLNKKNPDNELEILYHLIAEVAANGTTEDERFRPRPAEMPAIRKRTSAANVVLFDAPTGDR